MPTLREIFLFPPGSGGLNLKASPLGLGPEYLIEAQNVEYVTAGARSKRQGQRKINPMGIVEDSPATYVDQASAAGQKVLALADTTGFGAGHFIAIGRDTDTEEYARVASVQAGVSLTLEKDLAYTQPAETLTEQLWSTGHAEQLRKETGRTYLVQGFEHSAPAPFWVTKIELRTDITGTPSGNVWVEIWGNSEFNRPDPANKISDEANAVKVDVGSVATGWGATAFTFTSLPMLEPDTPYHIMFAGDYSFSASNTVDWAGSAGNAYLSGAPPYVAAFGDGTTWSTVRDASWVARDFSFRLYVATRVVKSAAVTGYLDFIKNNLQQIGIVAASNGRVYTESGGFLTERLSGFTQGTDVMWVMAVFKDNAIIANQVERPRYTSDGVTFTEISDATLPTTAGLPVAWRNRLWVADGDTLYYSSLDSFTDWTTTGGNIPIRAGKGPITALISFGKVLVVGKADAIILITGSTPDDFDVQPLAGEAGIVGPHAWAQVGNDIIFVTLEDVSTLQTVIDFADIKAAAVSRDIEPFFRDEVNPNRRSFIQCAYYQNKGQFWMTFADRNSTIEDRALVYDVAMKGWAHAAPVLGHVIGVRRSSLGYRQLVIGGHDGFLKLLDTREDDDGEGIVTVFQTPHLDLGRPNEVKHWRKLILFGKGRGASLEVDYEIDFQAAGSLSATIQGVGDPLGSGAGSFQLNSSVLGSSEVFSHEEFLLEGSGHFISFTFTNSNANESFALLGVGLEAMPGGTDKWAP